MAHSYVVSFNKEIEAFRTYCKTFPKSAILLIDTYDSLEGARKAAEIAGEMESEGYKLKAVRLDSGDLLKLSKEARNILDNAGRSYVKIFASSDLNEWKIQKLLKNGAPIDAFGVGTEMVTGGANSALGGVYKLVEIEDAKGNAIPKLKLSDESEKTTLPGKKTVWRFYDSKGMFKKDVIALEEEVKFSYPFRKIFIPLVQKGKIVYRIPSIKGVQDQVRENLALLPEKYRALDHAPEFPVSLSDELEKLTHNCIHSLEHDSGTS
jgi:nicotinate phosphoribosyltransferase